MMLTDYQILLIFLLKKKYYPSASFSSRVSREYIMEQVTGSQYYFRYNNEWWYIDINEGNNRKHLFNHVC